jgi:hypothetical protein
LGSLEAVQRGKLARYLESASGTAFARETGLDSKMGYEEFARWVPVRGYREFEPWIERQRSNTSSDVLVRGPVRRFEPTSGSTSKRKWIPYSSALMEEFDLAASAWIFDLTLRHPSILSGPHYWSLSWIPTELRSEISTVDDLEVFPFWKKILMNRIMAVPSEVSRMPTLEASLLATLAGLAACRELSFVSVWSPTFLLQQLRSLSERRLEIAAALESGSLGARSRRAAGVLRAWDGGLTPDFLRELWPRLALISAWDSSTSALWADELRRLFPRATVQGKGLWATEGVVTIPFQGRYPLAASCHFYEFRDLATGGIFPAWKLRREQLVQPLLTTGSGFFRYEQQDRLRVTGFLRECPCFEFVGRLGGGTDLVGEKMDPVLAGEVLNGLNASKRVRCLSLLACRSGAKPRYAVLAVGDPNAAVAIAKRAEELLLATHHYRLARELGQLDCAEMRIFGTFTEAQDYYERSCLGGARVAGGAKIEALALAGNDSASIYDSSHSKK